MTCSLIIPSKDYQTVESFSTLSFISLFSVKVMRLPDIKYFLIFAVLFQAMSDKTAAQGPDKITEKLVKSGFENVRCLIIGNKCYASIENHTYRWDIKAISDALDIIAENISGPVEINLIILENGVPKKLVKAGSSVRQGFATGNPGSGFSIDSVSVSHKTTEVLSQLKNTSLTNSSAGKTDLVIYPQLYFENTRLDKFYETQINIAPALEISLWKRSSFTGQVIIPIQNSMGPEGDNVRPGIMALNQEFRLSDNLMTRISAGNFGGNVYGISVTSGLYFFDGNFNLELMAGLIGSSHFIDGEWIHSPINRFTSSVAISYFWSRFNMEMKAGGARYIHEDYGLFASVLRIFNETSVGLFAQLLES